jgi:hypothetical protein
MCSTYLRRLTRLVVIPALLLGMIAAASGAPVTARAAMQAAIELGPTAYAQQQLKVVGEGFPLHSPITLWRQIAGQALTVWTVTHAERNGTFVAYLPVGNLPIGTRVGVLATAPGVKIKAPTQVTVLNEPRLFLNTGSGPMNRFVTLHGQLWPANAPICVGWRIGTSGVTVWRATPVYADAAGNFRADIWFGPVDPSVTSVTLLAEADGIRPSLSVVYQIVR